MGIKLQDLDKFVADLTDEDYDIIWAGGYMRMNYFVMSLMEMVKRLEEQS